MQIKAEEISKIIEEQIRNYEQRVEMSETGTVLYVGDGIARVYGVQNAMSMELLEFPGNVMGMVLNLEEDNVGVALLGSDVGIKEGDSVRRTGKIFSVPVGDKVMGRVLNPLGEPIDGLGPVDSTQVRPVEIKAPGIIARKSVHEPMPTGLKAIDAMTPIGRGQRELIIGDRQTGKTAVCIDAILAQKETDIHCFYVAIGQKKASVALVADTLRRYGAMEYTTIISATASEPAPLQYIAAYTGYHGRALPGQRQARPDYLRRPFQAGRGLPADVPAAPPAAGARSLPRRRVLPALASSGARGKTQ